jgi:hypothetical protein
MPFFGSQTAIIFLSFFLYAFITIKKAVCKKKTPIHEQLRQAAV